jgi:hypothetical protein
MIQVNLTKRCTLINVLRLQGPTWATMTATGARTMQNKELEGWSEKIRRRSERIFGLVFLILLAAILLISVSLFVTAPAPAPHLPSADTPGSGDSEKDMTPALQASV